MLLLPTGSVTGIDPVVLPSPGYLDNLKASGELKGMEIELVGYGAVPSSQQPGGTQFAFDGVRRTSSSVVIGLSKSWLRLLQNSNVTDLGGVCFGDSGSPQLVPRDADHRLHYHGGQRQLQREQLQLPTRHTWREGVPRTVPGPAHVSVSS